MTEEWEPEFLTREIVDAQGFVDRNGPACFTIPQALVDGCECMFILFGRHQFGMVKNSY